MADFGSAELKNTFLLFATNFHRFYFEPAFFFFTLKVQYIFKLKLKHSILFLWTFFSYDVLFFSEILASVWKISLCKR